jgi:hypothetical protein
MNYLGVFRILGTSQILYLTIQASCILMLLIVEMLFLLVVLERMYNFIKEKRYKIYFFEYYGTILKFPDTVSDTKRYVRI